ncbi:MAG: hypothetical protein Q9179_007521 [Wetmoreana sp. 5 TL-2023]
MAPKFYPYNDRQGLEQAVDDFTDEADLAEKEAASLARTNATAQARFEEHRTLFEWLDPVDPHVNYQKAVSLHEPHTGQWIFSSPELEAWFSANNGVLWLHAKPGAGKTIMASTMITFQWVKCQFDMLCSCISDKKIYDSLQSVPKGLDETYIRILARIRQGNSGDIETIKRMFFWLTHSLKPLTIVELADAITLHPGQKTMDFSAVATEPLDLLQFSGGLITTMEDGKTVCLAHFSIKEFFLSHRIESTVSEFYADNTKLQWEHNNVKVAIMNAWSPMYNAAHYSLAGLVEPLCQMRCNVNERGGQYHYPLLAAARHKKHGPAIITILIAMNADINVRNYRGNVAQNGIVQASEHWDLLKDLVRHGLELRGGSNRGMGSIIGVIAEHPSDAFQMVEFLLDNGADMDDLLNYPNYPDDNEGYTHFEERGSNVNVGGGCFGLALAAAIAHENYTIANILLEHDADPNGGKPSCYTSLFSFLKTYLEEPTSVGRISQPIVSAIRHGNTDLVRTLLERGADLNSIQYRCQASLYSIDAPDYSFRVHPLCQAIESGHHSMIELLISKGADPFKGNFCAALLATKKSNIQLLQELVDTKPFDHTIGSALVDALSLCQDDATSQLLINIINNKPFQPIQEDFAALL